MLDGDRLVFHYGRVRALSDVSLSVGAGELVALLGSNGAGKTTTLSVLSGLMKPDAGTVRLDGETVTGVLAGRGVAHVPEGRGIFPRLTVQQNLLVGLYTKRRARPDRAGAVERAVHRFPALRDRLQQRAGTLSGGEQQMLAVARALVSQPRVLLVDEPSHGLAPNVAADLFDQFEGLRDDGLALLVVEQYAELVLRSADRIYVLEKGRITYDGDPAPLARSRDRLADAYLGRLK